MYNKPDFMSLAVVMMKVITGGMTKGYTNIDDYLDMIVKDLEMAYQAGFDVGYDYFRSHGWHEDFERDEKNKEKAKKKD